MKLKCLGTGSSGNSYAVIDKNNNILLLDVGITFKEIKIGIDFQISKVKGALITHGHHDHALAARDFEKAGIPIIAPYIERPKVTHLGGGFMVQFFPLTDNDNHFTHSNGDGSECPVYGYVITHDVEPVKMIYITDCSLIKWRFKNVNALLLGLDYSDKMLAKEENQFKKFHVLNGHMELNTGIEFIKTTDRDKTLKNIIIGHLSGDNADGDMFKSEIQKVTDSNIYIAERGKSYEIV